MAEEGSVIILTHGKLRRVGFSVSHLSLFYFLSLSLSHSHSLSYSLSHKLIYLFYTLTLSLHVVINSIELIWTSPFQKYSLNLSHSAQVMSHISALSHIHLWLSWCATWLGLFFCPFFRSHHERANDHITSSEWVSEN